MRTYVFVDGAYLREGLTRIGSDWSRVNVRSLANHLVDVAAGAWLEERFKIARVFLYDALPDPDDPSVQDDTSQKVASWLEQNSKELDLHVRQGRLAGTRPRRQKRVDTQLAVDAVQFAANGVYEAAFIVAGDADFAPVAEAVRERGPLVVACVFRGEFAEELRDEADRLGYLPGPEVWRTHYYPL